MTIIFFISLSEVISYFATDMFTLKRRNGEGHQSRIQLKEFSFHLDTVQIIPT